MGILLLFHPPYTDVRLCELTEQLDALHTAASEGTLAMLTTLSNAELVAWLRELQYIVQETLAEIERSDQGVPPLRLVK